MTWTRVEDDWNERVDDVYELSIEAELLHLRALVYCNKMLTDGRIKMRAIKRIATRFENVDKTIEELVDAGLWKGLSENEFQIDWAGQETADAVRSRQDANRERQARYRARGAEMRRNPVRNGVTHPASDTVSSDLPVPSRPVPKTGKGKEEAENPDSTRAGGARSPGTSADAAAVSYARFDMPPVIDTTKSE